MKARWFKHELVFKREAGTSRGTLQTKPTYFLELKIEEDSFWGECSLLPGLSIDDRPDYQSKLDQVCLLMETELPEKVLGTLTAWPSIRFGVEMVYAEAGLIELENWSETEFEKGISGIPINGLIWMGDPNYQRAQLKDLYQRGFRCIKFKIGKDYWEGGRDLLQEARDLDSNLEIRVDANGAFSPELVMEVLHDLADLKVHSIEQPIAIHQWTDLAHIIESSPIPIALDEELIFCPAEQMEELLSLTKPHFLILKPSLLGGWSASRKWIHLAKEKKINYWITSALESQLGLQWVARFASAYPVHIPQGLGTGSLYINNLKSDLEIREQSLWRSKTNRFVQIPEGINENTAQGVGGELSKQRKDHSKSTKRT